MTKIKRALLSVSDKTGIVEFARQLAALDISILSTGRTAALLKENAIPAVNVSDYTGYPEMMDGRIKTLHPKIHGGLLGRRGIDNKIMVANGIQAIDLVVVNLYDFEATASGADCRLKDAINSIDIGGPAMLRSAAKNYTHVGVIVNTEDYANILDELKDNNGALTNKTRFHLAQKAFAHTARYDANISNFFGSLSPTGDTQDYPSTFSMQFNRLKELRYGENPHQTAAFYSEPRPLSGTLSAAKQLQGKTLSYNNIVDMDIALECALAYQEAACVIVKHANPCAVALDKNILQTYEKAYKADPTSAFGGIIAFNLPVDAETARTIIKQQFVEGIIAPSIDQEAQEVLSTKPDIRVLETGIRTQKIPQLAMKRISGGLLIQDKDQGVIERGDIKTVSDRPPTEKELEDLLFAWKVAKYVKSNAIVYAKNKQTVGIGAGQMSRIYSARIAALKAEDEGLQISGSVMASDAFFPFRDNIDIAAEIGITAIIQPGGSIRDNEIIAASNEANMAMIFTGMRHFLH